MSKPVALYNSGTIEGLSGNASGQVLTWNGTEWVPGTNNGGSGGGGAVYYMNNSTAAQAPTGDIPTSPSPKQLGLVANASQTTVTSATLSTSVYDLVCGFVTDIGVPATTVIPTGLWDFNVWGESNATYASQTIFQIGVFRYDTITNTLYPVIATSADVYMYDPSVPTQYSASVLMPQTTLAVTDRIYIELRAKGATAGRDVTFYFGDGTPTHVHTNLSGITGTGLVHVIAGVIQTTATAVNLAGGSNEVTGTLPIANGGTGNGATVATNYVFAGPATPPVFPATGVPLYRALVTADLPTSGIPYDIAGAIAGAPTVSTEVFRFVAVRACSIATTGNQAKAGTTSTAGTATFTIKKNGSGTDTLSFASSDTGSFTIASPITLAAGDVLTMDAGAAMYGLQNVGFTFFAVTA